YDFDGAERECQRAIELNPNSSMAHEVYARYLDGRGQHDKAITKVKTAIDLEPTSRFNQRNLGIAFFYARRYTEAVVQFKRVVAMDENFRTAYVWLVAALEMQGNQSEAFEWQMKLLALQKADEETIQLYKTIYQTLGWQGVLRERVKRFDQGDQAFFYGAAYNAPLGNKDKAFEYLEKAYQRRELWMFYLQVDPRLDSLRDDPRFDELVRRVGLK
ncbi:MAG: tetratricopeptide repeat protein, partial [Acidobacteriota bacterium]|nr:tetratricopeptide repeat protein [Acidobacteriota bacterium]